MTAHPLTARAPLGILVCTLLGLLAVAPTAVADDDDSALTWGVRPSTPDGPDGRSTLDFQVAPGTQITDWVAVTNDSPVAATFRVYAADATTDYDTAAFTLVGADQASTDIGAWTAVDSGPSACPDTDDDAEAACARGLGVQVTLDAGERRILPVTITVPPDATPGDHAAGIVASYEQQATGASGSTIQVEQRVGTRVYLRVDGPLTASVSVSGVVARYDGAPNPLERGTVRLELDVTNTGNVRLSGAPRVDLSGPLGIDVATVTLAEVANLMPGGTGHVTAELPDAPPLGILSATVTVTPEPGDGDTAQADVARVPVTARAMAWAVPWTALAVAVLLLVVVLSVLGWRRRSRRLLAADLADYAEQVRAEARAQQPDDSSELIRTPFDLVHASDESETLR